MIKLGFLAYIYIFHFNLFFGRIIYYLLFMIYLENTHGWWIERGEINMYVADALNDDYLRISLTSSAVHYKVDTYYWKVTRVDICCCLQTSNKNKNIFQNKHKINYNQFMQHVRFYCICARKSHFAWRTCSGLWNGIIHDYL